MLFAFIAQVSRSRVYSSDVASPRVASSTNPWERILVGCLKRLALRVLGLKVKCSPLVVFTDAAYEGGVGF